MSFEDDGYEIVDVPWGPLYHLKLDIQTLIWVLNPAGKISSLDEEFNRLCSLDRKLGGAVFDMVRELPSFLDVMRLSAMQDQVRARFGWEMIHLPYGLCQFRIDRPGEEQYAFGWHQDYPYNMIGRDAVTWWIPLTDVMLDMGPLRVVPGSHKRGIHPVWSVPEYVPGIAQQSASNRTYELYQPDLDSLEAAAVDVPIKAGQAIMMHTLLLHRSGVNRSDKARWVAIVRMGDVMDKDLLARGWQCARPNKPATMASFHLYHPELAHRRGI